MNIKIEFKRLIKEESIEQKFKPTCLKSHIKQGLKMTQPKNAPLQNNYATYNKQPLKVQRNEQSLHRLHTRVSNQLMSHLRECYNMFGDAVALNLTTSMEPNLQCTTTLHVKRYSPTSFKLQEDHLNKIR